MSDDVSQVIIFFQIINMYIKKYENVFLEQQFIIHVVIII